MAGPTRTRYYGWTLLAVFWWILLANLAFPMYGGAFLNSHMAAEFHFSRETLGLAQSVFLGAVGLGSPVVALLIGRLGIRRTLVAGNAAVLLGALLMGTVVASATAAVLVFGLVVGFGVAAGGNLTAQTAIPRWFVRRRALALALVLTASAVGGFIAPPLLNGLIGTASGGWRAGWMLIAGIAGSAMLLAALFVRESPEDIGQRPDGAAEAAGDGAAVAASRNGPSLREVRGTGRFWVLCLGSAAATGVFGFLLAHGIANARDHGLSESAAAYLLALVSLSGFGGKAIVAIFGDRFSPGQVWGALLLSMAIGMGLFAMRGDAAGLYAAAAFLGLGFGGVVVTQPATLAWAFGVKHFAQIAGAMYFIQALAGILTPWLAGRIHDHLHSYVPTFSAMAVLCVVSGILLLVTCRPSSARATG